MYLFVFTIFFGSVIWPRASSRDRIGANDSARLSDVRACIDCKSPPMIVLTFMACAAMPQNYRHTATPYEFRRTERCIRAREMP
jgi:hypothetical protein